MLADNYNTITHIDYQAPRLPDGFEELPAQVQDQNTAFTQGAYNHNPRPDQVYGLFLDTRIRAPFNTVPNQKPRLYGVHNKDPLPKENLGYVTTFQFNSQILIFVELKEI
jgi:hypothetical protein